jgi:hypothetical protein
VSVPVAAATAIRGTLSAPSDLGPLETVAAQPPQAPSVTAAN